MNILMLSDVYFPRVNGVSTSMQTYCRELVRMGHSVTIVAPDYGVPEEQTEFEIIRLPSRVIFFDPEDRLIRRSAMRATIEALALREWDVIHIHTPFRAHDIGVRLAHRTGRPTVESYHTYFEQYAANYLPWLPTGMLRFGVRHFSRRLCANVDHLIVPSEEMAAVLRGYGIATRSTVVPTGIHLDEFKGGDGTKFRRAHGIRADRPLVLTVSRLAVEKNIDFLFNVVRILVREFPELVFVVAGEGPDLPRLKQMAATLGIESHVRFLGNLDRRTALLDCYAAADVFLFASRTETQGLVLIEAMATGAPIVSTAVMGTATVLRNVQSALVSEEDVPIFASHVARLLYSPEQRKALSQAGPRDAAAWSAAALMKRVVDLYADLAASEPQRRSIGSAQTAKA